MTTQITDFIPLTEHEAKLVLIEFPNVPLTCPTCGSTKWEQTANAKEYWRVCKHGQYQTKNEGVN